MLYGDEKLREMARSILPSTAREWARWKKCNIKRNARREMRQLCHRAIRDWEGVEDEDWKFYPDVDINRVRRSRQGSDKLHHFERWAIKVTADMGDDPNGRRAKMQSILPEGLIGWHALQHLDAYDEFDPDRVSNERWRRSRERRRARRHWFNRTSAIHMLRQITQNPEVLALFNSYCGIKYQQVEWLLGYRKRVQGDRVRSCHHVAGRGQMSFTGELVPVVVTRGEKKLLKLKPGGESRWFDKVFAAAEARRRIAAPPELTEGLYFPATRVPNPEHDPYTYGELRRFLQLWRYKELQDVEKLREKLYQGGYYPPHKWWEYLR